jgi:hypothetical protein
MNTAERRRHQRFGFGRGPLLHDIAGPPRIGRPSVGGEASVAFAVEIPFEVARLIFLSVVEGGSSALPAIVRFVRTHDSRPLDGGALWANGCVDGSAARLVQFTKDV